MAPSPLFGIGLCGGALGLELGLEIALPGYRTVAAVEWETAVAGRIAARVQEGSIPPIAIWSDVTSFDGRPWRGRVHIISAGFPCQPFSVAGKRQGTADDRWIWPDIARIIGEVFAAPDPGEVQVVFLENVPGLLGDPDGDPDPFGDLGDGPADAIGGFSTVLGDLAGLGFDADWICLRASDVGASHGRKRVFILAYRAGPVADAGRAEQLERTAEPAGVNRPWTPDHHRGAGGTLGDARRGSTPGLQQERDAGREFAAPDIHPGPTMGDAERPERRPGFEPGRSSEPGSYGPREASGRPRDGNPILGAGPMGDAGGTGLSITERAAGLGTGPGNEGPATRESGEFLENTFRPGERGQDGEAGRGGRRGILEASHKLGDTTRRGLRKPSGSAGQYPDGSNIPLVAVERVGLFTCGDCGGTFHAYEDAAGRLPAIPCRWCGSRAGSGTITYDRNHGGTGDPDALEQTGDELGDADERGREGAGLSVRPARQDEAAALITGAGRELPIYAYGPADPRWADVLVRFPWLRPSLSQAEVESDFRDLADGLAAMVVNERTGALRALGNGVVPLQAAFGFIVLARRAGLVILDG